MDSPTTAQLVNALLGTLVIIASGVAARYKVVSSREKVKNGDLEGRIVHALETRQEQQAKAEATEQAYQRVKEMHRALIDMQAHHGAQLGGLADQLRILADTLAGIEEKLERLLKKPNGQGRVA